MSTNSFSVAFEDNDAVVQYQPSSDGDPSSGWETVYSEGSVKSVKWSWRQGRGVGVRRTRSPGATLSFKFYGTSVTLYGNPNQSVFSISLDGGAAERQNGTSVDGQIVGFEGLALSEHTIRLVVESPLPELAFDRAVFKVEFEGSLQNATVPWDQWSLIQKSDWTKNSPGEGAAQPSLVSGFTKAQGSTASLNFRGSGIYVFGDVNRDHRQYSVTLDGVLSQWNGASAYLGQAALLYFQAGLDPKVPRSITLRNLEPASFNVHSAVIFGSPEDLDAEPADNSKQTESPRSGPSTAVIVGSVVAAVSAVVMLLVIALLFVRRRRELRRRKEGSSITPMSLDISQHSQLSRNPSDRPLLMPGTATSTLSQLEASMPLGPPSTIAQTTHTVSVDADILSRPVYFQPDSSTMYSPSAATPSVASAPTWTGTGPAEAGRKGSPASTGVNREAKAIGQDSQPPPYHGG